MLGAGKSTLLRLLAGKRMAANIMVAGRDPFADVSSNSICYLGTEFANNQHVRMDIAVSTLLKQDYSDRCKVCVFISLLTQHAGADHSLGR